MMSNDATEKTSPHILPSLIIKTAGKARKTTVSRFERNQKAKVVHLTIKSGNVSFLESLNWSYQK